ncbi:hypothetical protein niasHS_003826 [Heterodera schachtii]|uniref:Uncharacterized protein n=1 Tax=Heterodera schachtii TaxID=97005 RepID=A0ABD2K3J4_HETSC
MFGTFCLSLRAALLSAGTPMVLSQMGRVQRPTSNPRILKIRRHKIKKMKRKKRYKKYWYQYQRRHAVKKAKNEAKFRQRMNEMLDEMRNFEPLDYVKQTMRMAKWEWHSAVAPTGRKKYPHWSTLMSLEELFGLEPGTHIDKRYGLPSLEERPLVDKLQEDYRKLYWVEDSVAMVAQRRAEGMQMLLERSDGGRTADVQKELQNSKSGENAEHGKR